MRLKRGELIHVVGHTGGVVEYAEPSAVDPRRTGGVGTLFSAFQLVSLAGGRLAVRGGSRVVTTFADVAGNAISDVLGGFAFSPIGVIVVAHSAAADKHYAYALRATDMQFALPVGTETEAGSRAELGWATATIGRPVAVEYFEKLYVVDASRTSRRDLAVVNLNAGALQVTNPSHNIDTPGVGVGPIQAYTIAAYNGVLFIAGYDSESGGQEPAILRHSFLGRDPSDPAGFDRDAYALIGAKGVYITAMVPGNSILLVAKESELYRITGTPKAFEGWHFGISPLDNTLGLGCTNPHALAHAAGWFYGVGSAGPWRSDGYRVELLKRGRDAAWGQVQNSLELATVTWHPERRRVLFGFCAVPDEAPEIFWKWDVDREQWDATDAFLSQIHQTRAIESNVAADTQAPAGLAQSFSFADHRATALTGTFTPGSTLAKTEVWLRHASLGSVQVATLDEGLARFTIDAVALGLDLKFEACFVKLRHITGGVWSEFTGEVEFYPRLRPPVFKISHISGTPNIRRIAVTNYANNSLVQNLYGDEAAHASWLEDWLDAPAGDSTSDADPDTPVSGQTRRYELTIEQPAFVGHEESGLATLSTFFIPNSTLPNAPWQDMAQDLALDRIHLQFMPAGFSPASYEVQYRVTGSGGGYTTATTYAPPASPATLESQRITITGLAASQKYDVRIVQTNGGTFASADVVMFTKLEAPTVAVAQGGLSSPDVDITVTVPASGDGKDVRVYSASNVAGTPGYNQLFVAQTAGAHVYNSTAGTCDVRDQYFACMVDSTWPAEWTHSDVASDEIEDPCL